MQLWFEKQITMLDILPKPNHVTAHISAFQYVDGAVVFVINLKLPKTTDATNAGQKTSLSGSCAF